MSLYNISLTVENAAGPRDTFSREGYIVVEDSVWSLPYEENFEDPKGSFIGGFIMSQR